jgi:hypothetical protein
VGLVVKTEYKPNPGATGVGKFKAVHPPPLNHAVASFPGHVGAYGGLAGGTRATLQPTAHPSPLPAVVPYVSTWTDVHVVVAEGGLAALPTTQLMPSVVVMMVFPDPTIQPSFEFVK